MSGGCTGGVNTSTGSIVVNPNNTIALSSAGTTTAQTLCINNALTNITYATTGATGASFAGLPTGVTGSWSGGVATISGTPSTSGTFNYTVTMSGGCTGGVNTSTGSIVVNPNNTIALSSAGTTTAQTLCINTCYNKYYVCNHRSDRRKLCGLTNGCNRQLEWRSSND
jgi:hypothetical protein